jgi:hypothetical protein
MDLHDAGTNKKDQAISKAIPCYIDASVQNYFLRRVPLWGAHCLAGHDMRV